MAGVFRDKPSVASCNFWRYLILIVFWCVAGAVGWTYSIKKNQDISNVLSKLLLVDLSSWVAGVEFFNLPAQNKSTGNNPGVLFHKN